MRREGVSEGWVETGMGMRGRVGTPTALALFKLSLSLCLSLLPLSFSSFSLYFYSFFLNAFFYLSLSASLSTLTLSLLLLDSIPFLSLFLSPFCTSAGIAPIFASRYLFFDQFSLSSCLFKIPISLSRFHFSFLPVYSSELVLRCPLRLSQCRSSIS